MADTPKILGQKDADATTLHELYAVPSSTNTTVSSFVVCNRGATATTFRITIEDAGATTGNEDYLYYDVPIAANDTFVSTIGVCLEATDTINVYAGNGNLTFQAFGVETT